MKDQLAQQLQMLLDDVGAERAMLSNRPDPRTHRKPLNSHSSWNNPHHSPSSCDCPSDL